MQKATWFEIYSVVLEPGKRSAQVPSDTQRVPLELKVRGFLLQDAVPGEKAKIRTLAGRVFAGRLLPDLPVYEHSFGCPPAELRSIGEELRDLKRAKALAEPALRQGEGISNEDVLFLWQDTKSSPSFVKSKALDSIEDEVGRPINLHSYVSGVAGPEIAVLFAEEGVNGAHRDPQYNVLYRYINMHRSFVDAAEAKRILADGKILQTDGAHNANATGTAF